MNAGRAFLIRERLGGAAAISQQRKQAMSTVGDAGARPPVSTRAARLELYLPEKGCYQLVYGNRKL